MKLVDLGEPTSFPDHDMLGMLPNVSANRMKISLTSTEKCSNHEFLLEQLKNCQGGRNLTTKTVAWSYDMEGHAQKMRREVLRTGGQKDRAVVQSYKSLLGRPSCQEGGTGISWRLSKSMLTDCLEMIVFGTKWVDLTFSGQ